MHIARLDFARVLISTQILEVINAVEDLLVDDKLCKIKVMNEPLTAKFLSSGGKKTFSLLK